MCICLVVATANCNNCCICLFCTLSLVFLRFKSLYQLCISSKDFKPCVFVSNAELSFSLSVCLSVSHTSCLCVLSVFCICMLNSLSYLSLCLYFVWHAEISLCILYGLLNSVSLCVCLSLCFVLNADFSLLPYPLSL
jgi:hypothetical protein